MRVLWVCNQCIPVIAKHLNIEIPNKEGWLSGLSEKLIAEKDKELELQEVFKRMNVDDVFVIVGWFLA